MGGSRGLMGQEAFAKLRSMIDELLSKKVDGTAAGGEDKWKGGVVNRDFSPKKAFLVLDKLVNKEWRTNVSFDKEDSQFHFRGFYGTYRITYTVDGQTKTELVRLSKGTRTRPVFVK